MEWTESARDLLNELLTPVPVLERSDVKRLIKEHVEWLAAEKQAEKVQQEHLVQFYLEAPPDLYQQTAVRHLKLQGLA